MNLQGILFDIDGTLVDSNDLHTQCWLEAFASSAGPEEVEYYSQLLEIEELLEGTTSKGDAEFSKPSPEIFRAALKRIGTDELFTFVVGDTPYDVLAAHRVPLPVAAVLCGGFERETLKKAEFIYTGVHELLRKIDQIDDYFDA